MTSIQPGGRNRAWVFEGNSIYAAQTTSYSIGSNRYLDLGSGGGTGTVRVYTSGAAYFTLHESQNVLPKTGLYEYLLPTAGTYYIGYDNEVQHNGAVLSVSIVDGGASHSAGDDVTMQDNDTSVGSFYDLNFGSGYSVATGVATTSSGSGTGCTVNVTQITGLGGVEIIEINAGGTGYVDDEELTISGSSGTASKFKIKTTGIDRDGPFKVNVDSVSGGAVTGVSLLNTDNPPHADQGLGYKIDDNIIQASTTGSGTGLILQVETVDFKTNRYMYFRGSSGTVNVNAGKVY